MFRLSHFLPLLLLAGCTIEAGEHPNCRAKPPTRCSPAPDTTDPATRADGGLAGCAADLSPGPPSWTLTGEVIQVTPCPDGGEADDVYVALSAACGDWTKLLQKQQLSLSAGNPHYYFVVPDGTYHLVAFADCDGSAKTTLAPGPGDVQHVTANPGEPEKPCRTYRLKGQGLIHLPLKLEAVLAR